MAAVNLAHAVDVALCFTHVELYVSIVVLTLVSETLHELGIAVWSTSRHYAWVKKATLRVKLPNVLDRLFRSSQRLFIRGFPVPGCGVQNHAHLPNDRSLSSIVACLGQDVRRLRMLRRVVCYRCRAKLKRSFDSIRVHPTGFVVVAVGRLE